MLLKFPALKYSMFQYPFKHPINYFFCLYQCSPYIGYVITLCKQIQIVQKTVLKFDMFHIVFVLDINGAF